MSTRTPSTAPLVSVLIPVRDAAATLGECLDSVAAQTLARHEVLVVDDGSRDDTATLVRARRGEDRRIRLIRPGRVGLVAALNTGLDAARAHIVARLDGDDRIHPERLARQYEWLLRRPALGLVGSRVRLFPATAVGAGMREYRRWQNSCLSAARIADERYVESPFVHPSVTFRRDLVRDLGGYRHGDFPEDYELWLRMARAGVRMSKLARVLTDWRQHPGSLSRNDPRYSREAFDRLRARYLADDSRLAGDRPLVFWGAGRRTRQRCRHLMALGHRPTAWIDIDPRKIGNRLQNVPVHAPEWLAARQPRPLVLGWVASHGARASIESWLTRHGYRRGHDYLMIG